MPGKEWTTPEQKEFLRKELVPYRDHLNAQQLSRYWTDLYQRWAQLWPERATTFPTLQPDDSLTPEQMATLATAITKRHKQWLRWHAGAGKNRSANKKIMDVVDDLIKVNTCIKQPLEIYSKMYYTSRVKPEIPLDSMDTNISMLRQQTERKFKTEPKEIQDEVMCIHKKQITSKNSIAVAKDDEAHLNIDVEVHQSNIQQCAPALQQILDHLSRKTGWSFSILMGGPDPIEPEGQCVVVSLHTGNNSHGKKFGESYSAFDSTIVQAYAKFLDSKYRKSPL
ncbi:hypothetical protein SCLCIDRAFT_145177 [Scleroderma citrinum Foug A]|uniref:Uncharacterized protein n=1 Tax=Scleroderma citrinum Foug A TaxID=1036808 RepID=A0A0C2YLF6_9AGAM|nr:hypothetical protein SCLCIDRAFT_145177 [Scleroderma citrinum Foug A]